MKRLAFAITIIGLLISLAAAQSTRQAGVKSDNEKAAGIVQPSATPNAVAGSGTSGRISKWLGVFGSSTFTIGDSNITEDKYGKVGVNTANPTSPLTVQGMIETTLGGVKFPDGTVQTTAALSGLQLVIHDLTLQGEGTSSSPLGVAIPLNLSGTGLDEPIIRVANTSASGAGLSVRAGDSGGTSDGGLGINARGGNSINNTTGGNGADLTGGESGGGEGGRGVLARGGDSDHFFAGVGVEGIGGDSGGGFGGTGVIAGGGMGSGAGNKGGPGIFAAGGLAANGASVGLAGEFQGDVLVAGRLSKSAGSFKIDHPLDPENKYLYHSFVESPDMKNIYDGTVTTDANGDALVTLPDYFEALNRDFRYQLTVIGTFAQAIISNEIENNHFRIKTGAPNVKVSWQVTGIRQDAYANKHRIQVEEAKPEPERGTYIHPESFNQPEEKSVVFVQHPQVMQRMKETREKGNKAREN